MTQTCDITAKICGLKTAADVETAVLAGARFIGFNHIGKSPRYIEPEAARELASLLPEGVKSVSLFLDPSDEEVASARDWVDFIQLHGHETPERVKEIAVLTGKPIIKAIGLADRQDLEQVPAHEEHADILLFDAKPPTSGDLPGGPVLPGGNGLTFDWRLLAELDIDTPWMLSGGLDAGNVKEAISLTGARMVDVASGVEETRGVKSPEKIRAFLEAVKEMNV